MDQQSAKNAIVIIKINPIRYCTITQSYVINYIQITHKKHKIAMKNH